MGCHVASQVTFCWDLRRWGLPQSEGDERKFPPSLRKETPDFQGWVGRPNPEPQLFS